MRRVSSALGVITAQTGVRPAAGRDGAGDDALAFLVARNRRAQFLDNANRFMTDDAAALDGVFSLQNMNVRAANRRRSDAQQSVQRADIGNGPVFKHDPPRFCEYGGFHHLGHGGPPIVADDEFRTPQPMVSLVDLRQNHFKKHQL